MIRVHGFAVLFLAAVLAPPADAAAVPAVLSPTDKADIARIEHYLGDIKTLQSKFIQVASNGSRATGSFAMWRPGRMRLVYDPPVKDYIIADGLFVFYWDAELQQQSSQPLGSSLADFFLRDTIRLSGDVTVTAVNREPGALEVSITETKEPGKGELTLVFEDKPFQLQSWRVLDAQNLTTIVTLTNIQTGVKFTDDMFQFHDPNAGRPHRH
jgi:outer membrane lipoprotein-sorting protein